MQPAARNAFERPSVTSLSLSLGLDSLTGITSLSQRIADYIASLVKLSPRDDMKGRPPHTSKVGSREGLSCADMCGAGGCTDTGPTFLCKFHSFTPAMKLEHSSASCSVSQAAANG